MKIVNIILVAGLFVALATGFAIDVNDVEENGTLDVEAAPDADPNAEADPPKQAEGPPQNPGPSEQQLGKLKPEGAEGKGPETTGKDANPTKQLLEAPKGAPQNVSKSATENTKSPVKDAKAATKSEITETTTNAIEDEDAEDDKNDAEDNEVEETEEFAAPNESATDEKQSEETESDQENAPENVPENSAENAPESNGEPDEANESKKEHEKSEDVDVNASDEEAPIEGESSETEKESACNIKFKKVGCYKSKATDIGFQQFVKSDPEMQQFAKKGKVANKEAFNQRLPQMVCECAQEALKAGNAVFSMKNIAECWTGPDSTVYDQEGPSDKCVTFNNQKCDPASEICSGKKHSNFVYYIDTPEHTKSQQEITEELADAKKKKEEGKAKRKASKEKKEKKDKKDRKDKGKGKGKGKKKHSKA